MLRLNVSYSIENIKYNNAPPAHHKSISNNTQHSTAARETYTHILLCTTTQLRVCLLLASTYMYSLSHISAYSSIPTVLLLPSPPPLPLLATQLRRCLYDGYVHVCLCVYMLQRRTPSHHSPEAFVEYEIGLVNW